MVKVFIINLKRSKDRYNAMHSRIATLLDMYPFLREVLEFEFFEAIDAKAKEHKRFEKHYNHHLCVLLRGKVLSEGELACFASHYTLWQKCAQEDKPCIILEDDVCFSEHFAQGVLEIVQSNYEYVRLMALHILKSYKPTSMPHIISTTQICSGTQGYYLTPSGARKFLAYAGKWIFPVDDYMDMFYIHKVWILVSMPYLLAEDQTSTDISDRAEIKAKGLTKITREISRFGLQVYKLLFYLTHFKKF